MQKYILYSLNAFGYYQSMNDKIKTSMFRSFKMIPNEKVALQYLEGRLWPKGPVCPTCHFGDRITVRKGGYYRCNACKEDFTVRTGTIFQRSHIPLNKWLYVMYLLVTSRQKISSLQLSKEIGITQKSAWFMLQRLRKACGSKLPALRSIIEENETHIGGKERNKHSGKRLPAERYPVDKSAIISM